MFFNLEKTQKGSEWEEYWSEIQPTPLWDSIRAQFRRSVEERANLGNRRILTGGDSGGLITRAMQGTSTSFGTEYRSFLIGFASLFQNGEENLHEIESQNVEGLICGVKESDSVDAPILCKK